MATAPTAARLSPAAFVEKAAARDLSLSLDETGQILLLDGPEDAITPAVCDYIRANKPTLIAYLRKQTRENSDRTITILQEENQGCVLAPLVQEEPLAPFPLPEIIYHEDPAAFWRDYKRPKPTGP